MHYISTDDPKLEQYLPIVKEYEAVVNFCIGEHKYLIPVLNYFSTEVYPNVEYYQEVNDDHVYISEAWDVNLVQTLKDHGGWGIAYPFNTVNSVPSSSVFSGNIIRALGFFNPPCFRHTWADDWTHRLGRAFNFIYFRKDIVIDHRCWHDTVNGIGARAPKDSNADFVYGAEEYAYGCSAQAHYMVHQWHSDIAKLKLAMEKNNG